METKPELCNTHKLEYVAVNESLKCEPENRYQCVKCLINKIPFNQVSLLDDAQNKFKEMKSVYNQRKEAQSKKNLEIMNELSSNIITLKNFYNQQFDKIIDNINSSIDSVKERQNILNQKLEQIQMTEFLSSNYELSPPESDYNQIQGILQTQFDNVLNTDLWTKCQSTLASIDDQQILFVPEQKPEIEEQLKQRTPYLPLTCDQHDKEIVQFDLTQSQKAKVDRIACIKCSNGKIGPYTDLETAQDLWNVHQDLKKELLNKKQEKIKSKIDNAQKLFNQLMQRICNSMNSVQKLLVDKDNEIYKQYDQWICKIDKNWKHLSKEEVQDIAEILSNPEHKELQKQYCQSQYNQQSSMIDEIIRQSLLHLGEIYSQCINSLTNLIDQKTIKNRNQDIETQAQYLETSNNSSQTIKELKITSNIIKIDYKAKMTDTKEFQSQTNQDYCINNSIFSSQYCNTDCQRNIKLKLNSINISYLYRQPKPANYQLQSQYSITQNETSFAIAINSKQTIMIAGCEKQIKVFEFQNGQMKQTQLLSDHTGNVFTLYFMKKTNQFISGSNDKTIRIWSIKDNQQYYCQQLLNNGHTGRVNQVIMNTKEDLIISCSADYSIKFWIKKTEWECNQTLTVHTSHVWQISLNDQENQLVSCGEDSQIIISQLDGNNKWNVYQTIKVEQYGYRICYIGDNMIAYQQYNGQKMDIFELNQQNKQFIKSKDIKIENDGSCTAWFPQIFNKQKSILLNKNGFKINLMKRKNNGEIVLEQTIKFGHYDVYGTMTEDGEYLITWDQTSKQFQVRKQQQ